MNTYQLNRVGRHLFGYRYLGTYALDQVPTRFVTKARLQHFIINTHTSNLPGEHWVAVSVQNNIAYIFDSFGIPPPTLLVSQLKQRGITKIYYNKKQIQPFDTTICGQLSLKHLLNVDLRGGARGVSSWKAAIY